MNLLRDSKLASPPVSEPEHNAAPQLAQQRRRPQPRARRRLRRPAASPILRHSRYHRRVFWRAIPHRPQAMTARATSPAPAAQNRLAGQVVHDRIAERCGIRVRLITENADPPERPDRSRPRGNTSRRGCQPERKPLCVKGLRRCSSRLVKRPSGAVAFAVILGPWPSSWPGAAVVLPHLQVVRPRFVAGAPPGPAASPAARWQRPGNGQLRPGHEQGRARGLPAAVVVW